MVFGIEFAPFNVPLERRLQTLAVVGLFLLQVAGLSIVTLVSIYLIFFSRLWWIYLLYLSWYYFIERESTETLERRSEWVRSWAWWSYLRDYFPAKLVKLPGVQLDPKKNYLFCCFPHGMLATAPFLTFATNAMGFKDVFPDHKPYLHTLPFFFHLPFVKEIGFWLGGLPSSRKSIDYVLGKSGGGNASGLLIGGAVECYYCKPRLHKVYLKNRKGFIKIALLNGSPLIPVYSFGETELYTQYDMSSVPFYNSVKEMAKRIFGFAVIFPIGRGIFQYTFGVLPHRRPVTFVVGEPIEVEKTENPTQEQIDGLHEKFEDQLVKLFESEKKKYLTDSAELVLEIV